MKIKMLSTQQESATGTTFQQGAEYDLPPVQAQAFVDKGWAIGSNGTLQFGAPTGPQIAQGVQFFPLLLSDPKSSRPDIMVHDQAEYEKAKADGYTVQIPAPGRDNYQKPVVSIPPAVATTKVPHPLRSKADLSKPLSTQEAKTMNPKDADRVGYPARAYEGAPVSFPSKAVTITGSRKPFGTFGAQTVIVKHHESVIDLLNFLGQPTDGSVELLRPDTEVPFALEDYPYAYLYENETLQLRNRNLRPAVVAE
jgi:hypothetical protein